jgi:hypothetical protein
MASALKFNHTIKVIGGLLGTPTWLAIESTVTSLGMGYLR